MINARGHIWEVRHEDEPNLMDRRAVLNCTVCKVEVARRRIQAFRKFSFRIVKFWSKRGPRTLPSRLSRLNDGPTAI